MLKKQLHDFLQVNPAFQFHFFSISSLIRWIIGKKNLHSDSGGKGFIYIVGSGRSGNTLLRKLMVESLDIYIPPESYVIPQQIIKYCNSKGDSWSNRVKVTLSLLEYHQEFDCFELESLRDFVSEACTWTEEKHYFDILIVELYRWFSFNVGIEANQFGDKTPLNTLSLGLIKRGFPNAGYIYLRRDPVDVVYSYIESEIYRTIEDASQRWLKSEQAWDRFKRMNKTMSYLEVSYEDLVTNTDKVISDISLNLGVPYRFKKLDGVVGFLGDVNIKEHHQSVFTDVNKKSIGKGRGNFSEEEILKISEIIGGL